MYNRGMVIRCLQIPCDIRNKSLFLHFVLYKPTANPGSKVVQHEILWCTSPACKRFAFGFVSRPDTAPNPAAKPGPAPADTRIFACKKYPPSSDETRRFGPHAALGPSDCL